MRKVFVIIMMLATVMTVSAQKKWGYTLGFGGELKSGNVNTTIFNTNAGVERNDSILSFDANASYVYGLKDGENFEDNLTGNLKFDLWQYDRWSPFVSYSANRNHFKGYDWRHTGLAGVKYRLFWNAACDYSISAAYVFEYTDYLEAVDLRAQVSRLSVRFKMRHKLNDNVSLKHTTFYTPSFYDFTGDWGVNSTTSLSTKLSSHLSLDLNFTYDYHSLVPAGVKNADYITSATLKMKF